MSLPKWATTVTPLSKALAMIIFVTFPIIGFFLGMKYQQIITISPASNNIGLANPAAVYCEEQGGKNEIITASDGSQSGQCIFSDGRKCDDWQFFRTKACK